MVHDTEILIPEPVKAVTLQPIRRWNSVGDAGAESLASAHEKNVTLHTLNLSSNSVGDAGAASLASALEMNASMHTLELGWNSMGAASLQAIEAKLAANTSRNVLK